MGVGWRESTWEAGWRESLHVGWVEGVSTCE